MISLNKNVEKKVQYIIDNAEALGCSYHTLSNGAHIIDMGVNVKGSFEAARLFTEVNMADLGTVKYRDHVLEDGTSVLAIELMTSEVKQALKFSQIASYPLGKVGNICLIGSGPGRAIAQVEEDYCFEGESCQDDYGVVFLGVQGPVLPDEAMAEKVAADCNVSCDKIYFMAHKTNSIVASVQVAGRILEQTLHKIMMKAQGTKIEESIEFAKGFALVAPVIEDEDEAMGRINDSLLYGGRSQYWLRCEDDEEIKKVLPTLVTEYSKDYGKLFKDLYLAADRDYYKMDLNIHSPAQVEIFNITTGNIFKAGAIREDIIAKSFFLNKR